MARVLPSQAVQAIDEMFSAQSYNQNTALDYHKLNLVAGVLAVLDAVPSELVMLDAAGTVELLVKEATLRGCARAWEAANTHAGTNMGTVIAIRNLLSRCPDQLPNPQTTELRFVTDPELRAALRLDIASVERAIVEAEWKTATVLGGSVIEALLLWRLSQCPLGDLQAAIGRTPTLKAVAKKPLEEWRFGEYIEAAHSLQLITDDTRKLTDQARDYRNLIHPGRSLRLAESCDRATAYETVAALDRVVKDLS